MTLNFVDEYIIQKVVTADNTYETDVAPSDSDNNFEPSDNSALLILILTMKHRCQIYSKIIIVITKTVNLNSLQSKKKKKGKSQREYRWRIMKNTELL